MANDEDQLTVSQKVVLWARARRGKRVERGECWDLGEEALKHAGAQTSNDLGPVGKDTDYVWGDAMDVKDINPGDLLQLPDHLVKMTTVTVYTFSDGSERVETKKETVERSHHTAIVNGKIDADFWVPVLEQQRGEVVQNRKLYVRSVPANVTKTHERQTNPGTKKLETAGVTRTVTITVTGKIWAYRAKAK